MFIHKLKHNKCHSIFHPYIQFSHGIPSSHYLPYQGISFIQMKTIKFLHHDYQLKILLSPHSQFQHLVLKTHNKRTFHLQHNYNHSNLPSKECEFRYALPIFYTNFYLPQFKDYRKHQQYNSTRFPYYQYHLIAQQNNLLDDE